MEIGVLIAIFVAVFGLAVGAYLFFNREALATEAAARSRLRTAADETENRSIVKDASVSHVPFLDRWLRGRDITTWAQARVRQSGTTQKPAVFILASAVLVVLGAIIGSLFGTLASVGFAGFGFVAPWMWLSVARKRRVKAFDEKFPDALDMMANAMRAGYSFQAAANFVGEEMTPPVGDEFARFHGELRLGVDVRTALISLQERIDSLNLKMFVTAVLIQRETGGNLTELLTNLATLMRERVALNGQIETLTAEPKLSARFLAVLPVLMFFGLSAVNREFMAPFSESAVGHFMLAMAALSVVIGYMMLMKIAKIDV